MRPSRQAHSSRPGGRFLETVPRSSDGDGRDAFADDVVARWEPTAEDGALTVRLPVVTATARATWAVA